MRKTNALFALLLAAIVAIAPVSAQETYVLADGSTIKIDGASNRSDWSVEATSFTGSFVFTEGMPGEGGFSVPVADMKSGRSLIMDRLMHGAFESDTNPDITFVFDSATPTEAEGWWNMTGQLEMAGASNPVSVLMEQQGDVGRTVRYVGSHELKMTDFGMKPPTAMFGSLHTRDEVTIHFDLLLASTCEEDCESDG